MYCLHVGVLDEQVRRSSFFLVLHMYTSYTLLLHIYVYMYRRCLMYVYKVSSSCCHRHHSDIRLVSMVHTWSFGSMPVGF